MPPNFSKLDLQKLTTDAAKYPNAGVPPEKMDFWRNLESSLLELHHIPNNNNNNEENLTCWVGWLKFCDPCFESL